jgi:phage gp36-like protein
MSYAIPADLILRKNVDLISDLALDDGSKQGSDDLATNAVVLTALSTASGMVDAAILKAQIYTPAELAGLTGTAQDYLKRMVCDIAIAILFARKPAYSIDDYKAAIELQEMQLTQLRNGEDVFNILANQEAGLANYHTPTANEINSLNLIVTQTRNTYPARRFQQNQGF